MNFENICKPAPKIKPVMTDKTTWVAECKTILRLTVPLAIALANIIPKADKIKHQASSIATTRKSISVTEPRARYSLITITVAAGAVAAAAAPSTKDECTGICFKIAWVSITPVTNNQAQHASRADIQKTALPDDLIFFKVKFAPRENAIIPNTKLDTKSDSIIIRSGMKSSILGPMRIPIKRYVVTAGKCIRRISFAPK